MPSQKVIITYSAPPAYLATDQWKLLHAALSSQLPLRNLHWKSASRPAIRTIQELQVDLVAVDTLRDEHTSQVPQSILERPLLNAFIVVCEVRVTSYMFLFVLNPHTGYRNVQKLSQEADQGLAH